MGIGHRDTNRKIKVTLSSKRAIFAEVFRETDTECFCGSATPAISVTAVNVGTVVGKMAAQCVSMFYN